MSYSNSSLYSVSNKAQFERPTIPPILKLAQQHQQTNISNNYITTTSNNAKSNIFSHTNNNNNNTTKFNSILSANSLEAAAEKKFLRQIFKFVNSVS